MTFTERLRNISPPAFLMLTLVSAALVTLIARSLYGPQTVTAYAGGFVGSFIALGIMWLVVINRI